MLSETEQYIEKIRKDFPILHQNINAAPLVYFDNAASTQKPISVINAIKSYYENDHSNVHRGVHSLSVRATESYEESRRVNTMIFSFFSVDINICSR